MVTFTDVDSVRDKQRLDPYAKEIMMLDVVVDLLTEGEARWWLLGAAAVVGVAKGGRSLAKGAIKGYFAARDGVTRLSQAAGEGLLRLQEGAAPEQAATATAE